MNPFMSCQCRVFYKGLITEVTFEQPLLFVGSLVRSHQTLFGSGIGAVEGINATLEHVAPMNAHVRG